MSKKTVIILSLMMACISCQENDGQTGKKVFHMNIHAGFTSMDPAFARNQANIWVCNQLYNGLVQLNERLEPVPAIARSWEIDSTAKIYTFYLRDDVYFHPHALFPSRDARRVTARDFVYSFNRIIDRATASPGAWIFNDKITITHEGGRVKGSFRALNDTTFQVELTRPFPPLLGLLSMQYCSVVPEEIITHYGKDFRNHPVGTGPFRMEVYADNERLILVRNDDYFEQQDGVHLPYLDAVEISFIPNKQNEFLAFLRGDLDFLSGIDGSFKDNLLTRDGQLKDKFKGQFMMMKIPFLNTEYLGILMDTTNEDLMKSPLRRKKVRQAINYGFDRKKMLKFLRNDIGRPATEGFIPVGLPSYDTAAVDGYSYKPQKARRLLAAAGYPEGSNMPEITLLTNQTYLDLCIFIETQLEELGMPVQVEVVNPALLREWMAQSKAIFFRGSWIADYPDAENYLALFYSPNFAPQGPNYTHFYNPRYDSLYEAAITTTDARKRYALYHRMENIIVEEAPVVVLYYDEVVQLTKDHVQGLERNAINLLKLKTVRLN